MAAPAPPPVLADRRMPEQAKANTAMIAEREMSASQAAGEPPAPVAASGLAQPVAQAPAESSQPQVAADTAVSPARMKAGAAANALEDRPSPDETIERIRKLLHEHRREAALAELKKLREAYPGLKLPPDLAALIEGD